MLLLPRLARTRRVEPTSQRENGAGIASAARLGDACDMLVNARVHEWSLLPNLSQHDRNRVIRTDLKRCLSTPSTRAP